MSTDVRSSSRWIGSPGKHRRVGWYCRVGVVVAFAVGATLLGACGSDSSDPGSAASEPAALALTEASTDSDDGAAADADDGVGDGVDDDVDRGSNLPGLEQLDDVEGMPGSDLTPERFEELRTDPQRRANVLAEMERQGLTADEAVCFLDNVSPELFITFGGGRTPDEAQFGELMELLVLCEVSFLDGR